VSSVNEPSPLTFHLCSVLAPNLHGRYEIREHGMALKWPSMCWCAVKKLFTHASMGRVQTICWSIWSHYIITSQISLSLIGYQHCNCVTNTDRSCSRPTLNFRGQEYPGLYPRPTSIVICRNLTGHLSPAVKPHHVDDLRLYLVVIWVSGNSNMSMTDWLTNARDHLSQQSASYAFDAA